MPNHVTTTVYADDRDPLDDQPLTQELVISDHLFDTLLLKITSLGDLTIQRVGLHDTVHLHLSADMATALATAYLQRIGEMEAWLEHDTFVKARRQAEAMTAEPTPKELPCLKCGRMTAGPAEMFDEWLCPACKAEQDYANGLLTDAERDSLMIEQATREAADNAEQLPDVPVAFAPHSAYPMK